MANLGPISSYVTSTANLKALRDVVISTQADGLVRELLAEEGDHVETGQTLCLLDDRELKVRLAVTTKRLEQAKLQFKKAKIQVRKAAVQVKNAGAELQRHEMVFAENLVSEEDVAALLYRLEELQHDEELASSDELELEQRVGELEGEIEQVRLEISRTRVTAPFSGYITHRTIELGQTVRSMDRLFRLAHFSRVHAEVHLSEMAARKVRAGQKATARLESGGAGTIQGRVLRVSPVVDESTGTVKTTVELLPTDVNFRPGAFVVVAIETDFKEGAVLIPKRAVVEQDGDTSIFVVDGVTARKRTVELGYGAERVVEVLSGIAENEMVVVAGQGNLEEGSKVRVMETSS